MQFTKAEEYGLLGVLYLAAKNSNSVTPLSEIAEAKGIPEKFLAKIFQSLSRSGIIRSHRGVRGGFSMAHGPEKVTIRQVLESIQGPYQLIKAMPNTVLDGDKEFIALCELLTMAEERLVSVFEEHTLSDLVKWESKKAVRA